MRRDIFSALERLAAEAPPEGCSLGDVLGGLDEQAFGAIIFLLALPCSIPFLVGVPQLVALPMLALTLQMAAGRSKPWLPADLANRTIGRTQLEQSAQVGRKWFGWLARGARPRLGILFSHRGERITGVVLSLIGAALLVPLPATDSVPGLALAVSALGLMTYDGRILLCGWVIGAAWFALMAGLAFAGVNFFG